MGQVAIVTGGSSGIGAAAAEYLAAHGCTVYEFSRHEKSGGSDWNCLRIKIVADRDAIRQEFIGIMPLINTSSYNAIKHKRFIVLFQQ